MDPIRGEGVPAHPSPLSVGRAFMIMLRNPWRRIVLRWNGKAAVLSALFRGSIFLLASARSHRAGRSHAALAEALFGALNAGFYGTLTQSLRFAEPRWMAELLLAGMFPLLFQIGDYCFHAVLGTQVFLVSMISSAVFTAFSAAFNLYIMRRDTLLVGEEGRPFAKNLGSLPLLALSFVVSGVKSGWRFGRRLMRRLIQAAARRGMPVDTIASQ